MRECRGWDMRDCMRWEKRDAVMHEMGEAGGGIARDGRRGMH